MSTERNNNPTESIFTGVPIFLYYLPKEAVEALKKRLYRQPISAPKLPQVLDCGCRYVRGIPSPKENKRSHDNSFIGGLN